MAAPLSFREKLGFSAGEIGGSGLWQISMIFLPVFYTDVFGVPAAAVGTLFLVVRIFDAINDPVMGLIADRTQTRWGRFRPYVLWMSVPFALLTVALFFAPPLGESGRTVYAYITYIGMMMVYTSVMIPFSALCGVMTSNSVERTKLNSYRFLVAFGAGMMVQGLVMPGVSFFGGEDKVLGYRVTMGCFAVLAIGGFVIAFLSTKERIAPVREERSKVLHDLMDLLKNRPWVIILSVSLVTLIYVAIRSAAQMYYFKYYVGDEDLVSTFMVSGTAAIMVGIFATGPLTKLLDKKRLYIICMFLSGVTALAFYWVEPGNVTLLFVLQILTSLATGPTMPLLWSMMADAADYSEWQSTRRATGLVFSASTFAQKAGGALGGAISMYVLSAYGYQANIDQSPEVLEGMRQMMSFYPAAGAFACVGILALYPLTAAKLTEIQDELQRRREEAAPSAETATSGRAGS